MSNAFLDPPISPIAILNYLIPQKTTNFVLPSLTVTETLDIIKKMQPTLATGHDSVTMSVVKKLQKQLAPIICHLINTIISSSIFPDAFKI